MPYRKEQLERLPARIQAFVTQFSTAQLGTVDASGTPSLAMAHLFDTEMTL